MPADRTAARSSKKKSEAVTLDDRTCKVCGTVMGRSADLARHMNTHLAPGQAKKFECSFDDCRFSSAQKANLKAHVNGRHTAETKYPCEVLGCSKVYGDQSSLSRHNTRAHSKGKSSKSGQRDDKDKAKASKNPGEKSLEPPPSTPAEAEAGPFHPATTHQSPSDPTVYTAPLGNYKALAPPTGSVELSFTKEFPIDLPNDFHDETPFTSSNVLDFDLNSMNAWGNGQYSLRSEPFAYQSGFQDACLQNDLQSNWHFGQGANIWG
ncbi:hypothetical protein FA13DRAFT_1815109 [Coprinellus micaceus]|uniref:C2H2-type domain-containing protein n=1 Tax=Coprinellus micaceus TaxID=71717 RepID=A0A4Y7T6U5_COPMI|nr:hypothetical protein FA13DRAFT_1815109 [Coprinellus micaceus]